MIYCNCKSNSVHFYFYFILTRESLCGNLDENLCQKNLRQKIRENLCFLMFQIFKLLFNPFALFKALNWFESFSCGPPSCGFFPFFSPMF